MSQDWNESEGGRRARTHSEHMHLKNVVVVDADGRNGKVDPDVPLAMVEAAGRLQRLQRVGARSVNTCLRMYSTSASSGILAAADDALCEVSKAGGIRDVTQVYSW